MAHALRGTTARLGEALREQRWDDHRYYHHNLVNRSLHFISATTFIVAYVIVWFEPAIAALLGWAVAMTSRQAGHFFFEPKDYDHVNDCTHEHKEEIKVGYNLARKYVLMGLWAISPLVLVLNPAFFGLLTPHTGIVSFLENTGMLWLGLAVAGLLFRTVQLFFIRDVETGLVWATKILTDPFSDFKLYCKAPGQLIKSIMEERRQQAR